MVRLSPELTVTKIRSQKAPAPMPLGVADCIAEVHTRSESITVENGVATAQAHVSVADKREGMSYIWRLRVVDGQERPLAGQAYDKQIFTMENNGQKEATFRDSVKVPAGARRVELALYQISPGLDLSFLNDDDLAKGALVARSVKIMK